MTPGTLRRLTTSLLIAAAYVIVAKLGLRFATVTHSVTLVWPSSGVALAALLLFGRRYWVGVAIGAFVANALTPGETLPIAAAISVGNTLEAVGGAALMERARFQRPMDRIADVLILLVLGGGVSTIASATIGVGGLLLGGLISTPAIAATWRVWWLGDLMGDLVCAPLVLALFTFRRPALSLPRLPELLALGAALVTASLVAFGLSRGPGGVDLSQPYAVFPLLVWAALRFGPRGAAGSNFVVSVVSIVATVRGVGPFAHATLNEGLFQLQTFMAVAVLTSLVLGAAVAERDRAIALRDDFLSLASHELNTPLSALQLDVTALGKLLGDGQVPPEKLRYRVDHTERQVKRLAVLVRRLLDSSQVAAGGLTLQPSSVDLAAIVRDVADRFGPALRDVGRTIEVRTPEHVIGLWDPLRLEVVVTNLVSNAVKYGRDKPIELTVQVTASGATLQVRDSGIGIPPAAQGRIFKRFERAVSGRDYPGLGLGLWITKSIVEAMQGTIEVTSAVGSGTTFTVTLPLAHGVAVVASS